MKKKLKEVWQKLTPMEKALVSIRDFACVGILMIALLPIWGILPYGAAASWLLAVVAISQAILSWKRSKATSIYFLLGLAFFLFVFFISKG